MVNRFYKQCAQLTQWK
jgi:flagellar biosynthesis/type III secretory pathway protein FliH